MPKAGRTAKPKLRFSYLGAKKRLRGVAIRLWTTTGTLKKLVVSLRRGRKLIARIRVARVTTHKRRLVLRHRGRMPRRGRYTLRVTQGRRTLLSHKLRIR